MARNLKTQNTLNKLKKKSPYASLTDVVNDLNVLGTELNTTVKVTSSAQGVAVPLVGGKAKLTQDVLLSLFPLPNMRTIADVNNLNIGGATKPVGTTISVADNSAAYGGQVVQIAFPANLVNAKVVIPLLPDWRGNYPKSLPKVEFHLSSPNYTEMPRLYAWACEDAAANKGYLWALRNDVGATSAWGLYGPYVDAWNGVVRPVSCTPYANVSAVTSPTPWNEDAPNYEVRSIALTVSTGAAGATININRVTCQEWARGAIITQMDGGYALSYGPIFQQFVTRGWPGVVSRANWDSPEYTADALWSTFAAAGWDVCQHLGRPDATPLDATVTPSLLRKVAQDFQRFIASLGAQSSGMRTFSCLTNAGPTGFDGAGVLRSVGVLGGRGKMADATFGIDPGNPSTDNLQLSVPYPGGWSPRWGRYNRFYQDCGDGATQEARNTFSGSNTEKLYRRLVAGRELAWTYEHRVQPYVAGITPTVGNVGPDFVTAQLAALDAYFDAQTLIPISATQADMLTYERPGDIHLDPLGRWMSRSSGKIAL